MIDTLRRFICHNNRCGKRFNEDGSLPIGSIRCPHCGSPNIDHDELSKELKYDRKKAAVVLNEITSKRIIIKVDGTKTKEFPTVYIMGADPKECTHGGILLNETISHFVDLGILKQIPHTEIIEKYFSHAGFLADCKYSTYYEIKKIK